MNRKIIFENLDNAKDNGYVMIDHDPERVAEDLLEFSAECEEMSVKEVLPHIKDWQNQQKMKLRHSSESIERAFITLRDIVEQNNNCGISAVMMITEQLNAALSNRESIKELIGLLETPTKWGGSWARQSYLGEYQWQECYDCGGDDRNDDEIIKHTPTCPINEDFAKHARIKELIEILKEK